MKCQYVIADTGRRHVLDVLTTAHNVTAGKKHLSAGDQTIGLEDSDQSTVNGDGGDDDGGGGGVDQVENDEAISRNDIEPTQPYFTEVTGEEEEEEEEEVKGYEHTVPYNDGTVLLCDTGVMTFLYRC